MKEQYIAMEWVLARYKGKMALRIRDEAHGGQAYYIRFESGSNSNYEIEVAFRRPQLGARPDHIIIATKEQALKLDGLYKQRHNIREPLPRVASTIQSLKEHPAFAAFLARKQK
jgi:hypothetical protein